MSSKNRDEHNRWRNKTVAFRVSPEEDAQIERYVQLSGLTKQDYITRRLTHKDVVVQGNPRVFKALRNQLAEVLAELQRIETGDTANDELTALRAEAEALRAENASLRAENDKLRPMAEQYSTIKEHLAGIELDAHQRAEEYERGVHERLAAMIGDCRAHCDSVLSTLGNTCINVTSELRRAENSISSLPAAFNTLRAGLEKLEEDK